MPRTVLPPTPLPSEVGVAAGADVTWTAADVANGNAFHVTGDQVLLARNTDGAAPHNVTVTSVPDGLGRTKDIGPDSIPANGTRVYPRFGLIGWRQADGMVYVSADAATIEFAVLQLT